MVKHPTIYNSGEYILLNGDMTERNNLYIEWGTYGGDTYSVGICFKKTKFLFGNTQWTKIKTKKEVFDTIKIIKQNSGIKTVREWSKL